MKLKHIIGALVGLNHHFQSGLASNLSFIRRMPVFYPVSGNHWKRPELATQAANNFPGQVLALIEALDQRWESSKNTSRERRASLEARPYSLVPANMNELTGSKNIPVELVRKVFQSQGCSKLEFSPVYSYMLGIISAQVENPRVLEIGIGTNTLGMVSAMSRDYRPGASLRSYKELIRGAQIFGADYDRGCLFQEDRISTTFADQTKIHSLLNLESEFGFGMDLVIDDGLHTTEANLNTLIMGLHAIKPTGIIYIEDISLEAIDVWRLVGRLLQEFGFKTRIIQQDSKGLSFLVERTA